VFPEEDYSEDGSTYGSYFTPGARPDGSWISPADQQELVLESSAYQLALQSDPNLVPVNVNARSEPEINVTKDIYEHPEAKTTTVFEDENIIK